MNESGPPILKLLGLWYVYFPHTSISFLKTFFFYYTYTYFKNWNTHKHDTKISFPVLHKRNKKNERIKRYSEIIHL